MVTDQYHVCKCHGPSIAKPWPRDNILGPDSEPRGRHAVALVSDAPCLVENIGEIAEHLRNSSPLFGVTLEVEPAFESFLDYDDNN